MDAEELHECRRAVASLLASNDRTTERLDRILTKLSRLERSTGKGRDRGLSRQVRIIHAEARQVRDTLEPLGHAWPVVRVHLTRSQTDPMAICGAITSNRSGFTTSVDYVSCPDCHDKEFELIERARG